MKMLPLLMAGLMCVPYAASAEEREQEIEWKMKCDGGECPHKEMMFMHGMPPGHGMHMKMRTHGGQGQATLKEKTMKKFHFFMSSAEKLSLSDDQLEKLKKAHDELKKKLIRAEADIEVLKIDLDASLKEHKIDVAKVNGLLDKKYDAKKALAKALVQGMADAKGVLSDDQYKKAKALWKDQDGPHKGWDIKKKKRR